MDQSSNQANLQPSSSINIKDEQSPRKAGDRIKRDEWSEGAVNALLEAYESKWALRNRAKLKGQDWEDVAKHVSSRGSAKTQTQCKNKIESMKKRYRLESATSHHNSHGSSWPLYSRLDRLLRGSGPSSPLTTCAVSVAIQPPLSLPVGADSDIKNPGLVLLESGPVLPPQTLPPPPVPIPVAIELEQRSPIANDPVQLAKEDRVNAEEAKSPDQSSDGNNLDTDSTSTPALYKSNNNRDNKRTKSPTESIPSEIEKKRKRLRRGGDDQVGNIAESIQWLAEAVIRSERARMDTIKELERMRVEAEVKRGEMDLKRTEIVANTQLEIARLFAYSRAEDGGHGCDGHNKNVDSRLGKS